MHLLAKAPEPRAGGRSGFCRSPGKPRAYGDGNFTASTQARICALDDIAM